MNTMRAVVVKFLQKTKLNKLVHKLYYRHLHGFDTANKDVLPAIERCFARALATGVAGQGDYVEFGIFKGYAFWYAQQVAVKSGLNAMRFFGFDSFQGLPAVHGVDETRDQVFYQGQYACSQEAVIENLNAKGVDWQRTFLIKGYFDQSLTLETRRKHRLEKLAIVLIDCDLYASTVDVLNFIRELILVNTIILFDDWNCFDSDNNKGQRKAFGEFLERNPGLGAEELFDYGLYGKVFAMHRVDPLLASEEESRSRVRRAAPQEHHHHPLPV